MSLDQDAVRPARTRGLLLFLRVSVPANRYRSQEADQAVRTNPTTTYRRVSDCIALLRPSVGLLQAKLNARRSFWRKTFRYGSAGQKLRPAAAARLQLLSVAQSERRNTRAHFH